MIDKTPRVGRFLFRASFFADGFFEQVGRITYVSGKRIYYKDYHEPDALVESYIADKTLTAVCDTDDEIDMLVTFNRRCLDAVSELRQKHKVEAAQFFAKEKQSLRGRKR